MVVLSSNPQALRPPRWEMLAAFPLFSTRPISRRELVGMVVVLGGICIAHVTQDPPGVLQFMAILSKWPSFYLDSSLSRIINLNPCIFHKKEKGRGSNAFCVTPLLINCKMNSNSVIHFLWSFRNKAKRYHSHGQSSRISMKHNLFSFPI